MYFRSLIALTVAYAGEIDIELVVSRFTEVLDWLDDAPFSQYRRVVYSKGPPTYICTLPSFCKVRQLPNVGRESHTYLTHIIDNYERLAAVTVFLPGSAMDELKIRKTLNVMFHIHDPPGTVFPGEVFDQGILSAFDDWSISEWQSTNNANRAVNAESNLDPCADRPFGNWYRRNFLDLPKITPIPWNGIFAVAKDHILNHPKAYYQNLLSYLTTSSNPECGHYFERAWGAIFYPYPDHCIHQSDPSKSPNSLYAIYGSLALALVIALCL
jgi:Protein of unknown function (DUF3431)